MLARAESQNVGDNASVVESGGVPLVGAEFIGHLAFVSLREVDAVPRAVDGGDLNDIDPQMVLD